MAEEVQDKKKKGVNLKVFLFGIPIFILQLVAVYYITANILLTKFHQDTDAPAKQHVATEHENSEDGTVEEGQSEGTEEEHAEEESHGDDNGHGGGSHIYQIDDVIVNPAGTNGKRLLLTSFGFDLKSEAAMKSFEEKEIMIKDIIISVLSAKDMTQLRDINVKDSIRAEIQTELKKLLKGNKVRRIYFSKYIIQ